MAVARTKSSPAQPRSSPCPSTPCVMDATAFAIYLPVRARQYGEADMMDRLRVVGFRESAQTALAALYVESLAQVRTLITAAPAIRGASNYADLQWRLDVRTASRSLAKEAEPTFLVELTTRCLQQSSSGGAPLGGGGGGGGALGLGGGGGGVEVEEGLTGGVSPVAGRRRRRRRRRSFDAGQVAAKSRRLFELDYER